MRATDTPGAVWNEVLTHHITPLFIHPHLHLFLTDCLCAIWSGSDLCKPQYEVIGQRFL